MTQIPTVTIAGVPDPLPEGLHVLDVREDTEWDARAHRGRHAHPADGAAQRLAEVPDGQTLVVCRVGGRSAQAAGYLAQQGMDVVNLEGGMLDWAEAGRPMVSETGAPPHVV